MTDKNGRLYFEYGVMSERVFLDDIAFAAQHILSVYRSARMAETL